MTKENPPAMQNPAKPNPPSQATGLSEIAKNMRKRLKKGIRRVNYKFVDVRADFC